MNRREMLKTVATVPLVGVGAASLADIVPAAQLAPMATPSFTAQRFWFAWSPCGEYVRIRVGQPLPPGHYEVTWRQIGRVRWGGSPAHPKVVSSCYIETTTLWDGEEVSYRLHFICCKGLPTRQDILRRVAYWREFAEKIGPLHEHYEYYANLKDPFTKDTQ